MPYASNRDRDPHLLELEKTPWPAAPLNVFMASGGFQPGAFDLCWDDPASLALNSQFSIIGVNVYRSFDSEFGPFERITDVPIGSLFWRDQTQQAMETAEVVEDSQWLARGAETAELNGRKFVFQTTRSPLLQGGTQNLLARPVDLRVQVNGVDVPILQVDAANGVVEIDCTPYPNVATQSRDVVTDLSAGAGAVVTVAYRYGSNFVRTDLMQRVFYRITTVGIPVFKPIEKCQPQDVVETPLERAAATSNAEIEKLDYIWREAVRRNRWILDQGGERVKAFLKKSVGQPCPCSRDDYGQPLNDCTLCFGARILGGYEGPYDIVIAPDDAERRISQRANGRNVEHTYEVWTGPSPLLSQRDFIVKIDGTRYSVGPVRRPSNRGMLLQQHFNIGYLDEKDIRYSVPVDNPQGFVLNQLRPVIPAQHFPAEVTDKGNIPDEREIRGRTAAWENITF